MRAVCALLFATACAAATDGRSGPSDAGLYQVETGFTPDPPTAGPVVMAVRLTLPDTTPVAGAALTAAPFHPSMGHGIAETPTVADVGGGDYEIAFSFSMPGTWDVPLTIDSDAGADTFTATVDVE